MLGALSHHLREKSEVLRIFFCIVHSPPLIFPIITTLFTK